MFSKVIYSHNEQRPLNEIFLPFDDLYPLFGDFQNSEEDVERNVPRRAWNRIAASGSRMAQDRESVLGGATHRMQAPIF